MIARRIINGGRVMVRMLHAVIVRRIVGIDVRYRNRFVRHCRDDCRSYVIRKTGRGAAPKRQCGARADDANEIGKGDQPPCRNSNSLPQPQRHGPK